MGSPPSIKKPPMGVENPSRLVDSSTPWETFFHGSSRRKRLCFQVITQRSASRSEDSTFLENVNILYVLEVAENSRLLLFFYTFEGPKFSRLAVVSYYGTVRSASEAYGKYPSKS